eukprot:835457-Pelagomonas_calceolata.AAC.2
MRSGKASAGRPKPTAAAWNACKSMETGRQRGTEHCGCKRRVVMHTGQSPLLLLGTSKHGKQGDEACMCGLHSLRSSWAKSAAAKLRGPCAKAGRALDTPRAMHNRTANCNNQKREVTKKEGSARNQVQMMKLEAAPLMHKLKHTHSTAAH